MMAKYYAAIHLAQCLVCLQQLSAASRRQQQNYLLALSPLRGFLSEFTIHSLRQAAAFVGQLQTHRRQIQQLSHHQEIIDQASPQFVASCEGIRWGLLGLRRHEIIYFRDSSFC